MDLLSELARKYGTDKLPHGFTGFYDQHLAQTRESTRKILEIGIFGGASLQMWRDYFPNAVIHGLDIRLPPRPLGDRIVLHEGDQTDRSRLAALVAECGWDFDLIIDDGGHTMDQQQIALGALFPVLRPGGTFIMEDLHTSFMCAILLFNNHGTQVGSYPTGVEPGVATTFDFVEGLTRNELIVVPHLPREEADYIRRHVSTAFLFDRDGDRTHVTSLLTVA
jgi:hypothetical protein